MNKNIYSDASNFDMTNNNIFMKNDDMVGGGNVDALSELNLDDLLGNESYAQNGGNDDYNLSSLSGIFTSSEEGSVNSDLFTPISSFHLTDTTESEQSSDTLSVISDISFSDL